MLSNMNFQERKHAREIKRRAKQLEERPSITPKEVVLIGLVGVVAALALYSQNDASTSFGLLDQPAVATELSIITSFRDAVLLERPVLELDMTMRGEVPQQISGRLFDVEYPPSVNDLTVLNTRIGGEVVLFWDMHSNVPAVNIYRTMEKTPIVDERDVATVPLEVTPAKEELIAEGLTEEMYIDADVQNGKTYTYRVVSVTTDGNVVYYSPDAIVTVVPADVIPPNPPTQVVVAEYDQQVTGSGVLITWVNPTDEDFERIDVYGTEQYGTRGTLLGSIEADQKPEYYHEAAEPNVLYYYTVIAVDKAGNESTFDYQLPAVGNVEPFTPFFASN